MKRELSAEQVVCARVSDTGEEVSLVLRNESGEQTVLHLPVGQLGTLQAWLEQASAKIAPTPGSPERAPDRAPAVFPVETWNVRPEPDEEHVILGFRISKGMELSLRIHRNAARAYVQALSSLLGRTLPASPSKARH